MIKAVILDDDPLSRKILENLIRRNDKIELVAQFGSPIEASNEIPGIECDLLFLDINMPVGIENAMLIRIYGRGRRALDSREK